MICKSLCEEYNIDYLNLENFTSNLSEISDARHYPRDTWKELGLELIKMYDNN